MQHIDLAIIEFFQSIRNPFLDWFFYIISFIGSEIGLVIIGIIIYWIVDKKLAHKVLLIFLISGLANIGLKKAVGRARPYTEPNVTQPNLPNVETSGESFPSGHGQNAGILGVTLLKEKTGINKKIARILAIATMVLIPVSRVYLMQHYLTDVIAGLLIGIAVTFLIAFLIKLMKDKEHIVTLFLIPTTIISMIFVDHEQTFIFAGGFVGFAIGYFLEKTLIKSNVLNTWWIQVLKVAIGLGVSIGLIYLLGVILPSTHNIYNFIKIFIVGIWASLGAPLLFKVLFYREKNAIETSK